MASLSDVNERSRYTGLIKRDIDSLIAAIEQYIPDKQHFHITRALKNAWIAEYHNPSGQKNISSDIQVTLHDALAAFFDALMREHKKSLGGEW